MKKKLVFTIGIPGSGKSTYLSGKYPVVETAKLRKIYLGDVNDWSQERFIFDIAMRDIIERFDFYDTVYLDATMVETKHRDSMLEEIGGRLDVKFEAIVFPADIYLSIERIEADLESGKNRANSLDTIYESYNQYNETMDQIEAGQVDFDVVWL